MAYADLNTLHNPATGTIPPASWGDQARDNLEFLIDPPACSVYHNTTQTIATGTTLLVLAANAENYDNNAMHSTVTNNSRITAITAGRYRIGVVLSWAANATGNRATAFRVNGTTDYVVDIRVGTATNSTAISGSRTLVLAANDYVEVFVWQSSGGNLDVTVSEFAAKFETR